MKALQLTDDHLKDVDLLRETLDQLKKDFGGIDLGLDQVKAGDNFFLELARELSKTLEALLDTHPERLFELLYRIDLPEERTKAVLTGVDAAYQLAEMVLKRELQKVVIRRYFSKD